MKISKARLKEIIKEEVALYKNEASSEVFRKYLRNDIKNLIQTAIRDYELSSEEIALIIGQETEELGNNSMNEARSRMEATAQIEKIRNNLHDNGYSNQDLKEMLLQIIEDIDSGFVGEPS